MNTTTAPSLEPFLIFQPDAETIYIDGARRTWRLEDLPQDVRRDVEAAVAQAADPEPLPSNASLLAASRALSRHVRDLTPDRRVALIVAAGLAMAGFASVTGLYWLEHLERCEQMICRYKNLVARGEQTIAALTEFNCQQLARELTGRLVLALKTTRRRRPRSTQKAAS